jgi:hypothetical protein
MISSEIDEILTFVIKSKKNPYFSQYYQDLFIHGRCRINDRYPDLLPRNQLEQMSPRHLNYVDSNYGTIIIKAILGDNRVSNDTKLLRSWQYKGNPTICLNIINCAEDYIDFGFIDKYGRTALIYTCINDLENVGIRLIETGKSNPNAIDTMGNTALIYCCKYANLSIAEKLLDVLNYSDISHKDKLGASALDYLKDGLHYTSREVGLTGIAKRINENRHRCELLITRINEILMKGERDVIGEIASKKGLPRELHYEIAAHHSLGDIKGQRPKKGGLKKFKTKKYNYKKKYTRKNDL